jgi:TrpR-related protein YerC/YecD
MKPLHTEAKDNLFRAILELKTLDDCYDFFEDICTIKEMQDMSQRLEVAALLHEGQSYVQICAKTGASTATIGRVNKCLNYGSGGYRKALEKINGKGSDQ